MARWPYNSDTETRASGSLCMLQILILSVYILRLVTLPETLHIIGGTVPSTQARVLLLAAGDRVKPISYKCEKLWGGKFSNRLSSSFLTLPLSWLQLCSTLGPLLQFCPPSRYRKTSLSFAVDPPTLRCRRQRVLPQWGSLRATGDIAALPRFHLESCCAPW